MATLRGGPTSDRCGHFSISSQRTFYPRYRISNRPDTTLEGLRSLPPHFDPHSGQGTVTAGNSSPLSDGASATPLMSRQRADQLNIPYTLVFRGFQVSGCDPDEMVIGPVFAVPKLLT
jgi:acetyl-CoA acetyltransferase